MTLKHFTSKYTKSINLNSEAIIHKSTKYSGWIEASNCKLMDFCDLKAVEGFYP